jgi:hypothetical protein
MTVENRKDEESKFSVFVEGGHSPMFFHKTYDDANSEATRLARKYPGKTVYVNKTKRTFKLVVEEVEA